MKRLFVVLMFSTLVSACDQTHPQTNPSTNPRARMSTLCTDYERDRVGLAKLQYASSQLPAFDCAHKYAFLLAPGSDSADTIATVMAQICDVQVWQWKTIDRAGANAIDQSFRRFAILELVRARGGHCPPP